MLALSKVFFITKLHSLFWGGKMRRDLIINIIFLGLFLTLNLNAQTEDEVFDATANLDAVVSQKPVNIFQPPQVTTDNKLLDQNSLRAFRSNIAELARMYESLGFPVDMRLVEAEIDILVALAETEHSLPPIITITGLTNTGVSRIVQHFVADAEVSYEPRTTNSVALYTPNSIKNATIELLLSPLGPVQQALFQNTFRSPRKHDTQPIYYVKKKGLPEIIFEIPGAVLGEEQHAYAERHPLDAAYHLEDLRIVVVPANYKDPHFLKALSMCRADMMLVFDQNVFPTEEQIARAIKSFKISKSNLHIAWRFEDYFELKLASEATFSRIESKEFASSVRSIPTLARFDITKEEKKKRVRQQFELDIVKMHKDLENIEAQLEKLKTELLAGEDAESTIKNMPHDYFRSRVLAIWESKHRDFFGYIPSWLRPILNPIILPVQKAIESQIERRVSTERSYFLNLADQRYQAMQRAPLEIKAEKAVFLPLIEKTIHRLEVMRASDQYSGEVLTEINRLLDPTVVMDLYKKFERDHTPKVLLEPGINARINAAIQRFAAEEPETYKKMQQSGVKRDIVIAAASPVAATLLAEGGRQLVVHKVLPMLFSTVAAQGTRWGFLKIALAKTGGFLTSAAVGAGLVTAAVIATPLIYRFLKTQKQGVEKSRLAQIVGEVEQRNVQYRIQWFLQWMLKNYTGELLKLIETQKVHAAAGQSLLTPATSKCLRSLL
jgi:hypothetical protein